MFKNLIILSLCLLPLGMEAKSFVETDSTRLSADGPYIVYDSLGSGAKVIIVDKKGKIIAKHYDGISTNQEFQVNTADGKHSFKVRLHNVQRPRWDHAMPERIFVTSDPHANFDCFYSLLLENGIINDKFEWTYGKGHFVMIGDVMDRGVDVLPIYWLIYKLEAEAAKAGGAVHFLMGNHEPMVLMNDLRYTDRKYTDLAKRLNIEYNTLFSPRTELGRWITSHNTIERIGRNVFVHAGLGREFYESGLTIPEVNSLMEAGLYKRSKERKATGNNAYFLFGSYGPIWYRGLVVDEKKYRPISSDSLDIVLNSINADRIIVGHTIHEEVSSFYNGRVIGVNVDNKENRDNNRSRALLIENNNFYLIGNKASKKKL